MVRHLQLYCMAFLLMLPAVGAAQDVSSLDQLQERARRAGVDPALLEQVARRAEHQGVTTDETARLLEPAIQLAERDFPARLVLQKTMEGLAKNVPHGRIQPVLQQIQHHTEDVGAFINDWMGRTEVQNMLGANSAGSETVRPDDVQALVESAVQARMQNNADQFVENLLTDLPNQTSRRPIRVQNLAAALRILPDLPPEASGDSGSRQLLTAVIEAGYEPEDIRQFPAAIRSAVEETDRSPALLARGAASEVAQGRPAAEVLNGLFNGQIPGSPPTHIGNGPPENAPPGQGQTPGEERGERPPEANGPPDDRGSQGNGPPDNRGPGNEGPPGGRGPGGSGDNPGASPGNGG